MKTYFWGDMFSSNLIVFDRSRASGKRKGTGLPAARRQEGRRASLIQAAPGVRNYCCGDFKGSQDLCIPFPCDCLENIYREASRCQTVLWGISIDKWWSLACGTLEAREEVGKSMRDTVQEGCIQLSCTGCLWLVSNLIGRCPIK